jgi:hypothetical protein
MRPRMKATLVVAPSMSDADVGLVFGSRGVDIRIMRGEISSLADVLGLLSGAYNIGEIASRSRLSIQTVSAVVEQLSSHHVVYDYSIDPVHASVDRRRLIDAFDSLTATLRFDMFRHELFERVASDERLFLATAVEYFHLIRDAQTHTAIALRNAPAELSHLLERYRASEEGHHIEIGHALQQALGGTFSLTDLAPLASTEAVILKTRDLACRDTLAYLACCSFAESRRTHATVLSDVARRWRPQSRHVLDALSEHANDDRDADHSDLFAHGVLLAAEDISTAQAAWILESVHEIKHYFDNLNHELLRIHQRHGASVPRLRSRFGDYEDFNE